MKLLAEQIAARIEATRVRVAAKRAEEQKVRNVFMEAAQAAVRSAMQQKMRFCHIRARAGGNGIVAAKGGVTVVYHKPRHSNLVTFAVTQCSPKDVYCRATGRIHAVSNWKDGRRVTLILPKNTKPSVFFKDFLFGYV